MNIYEKTFRDIFAYLAKRAVMLAAKLIGFKSFCLMLTTIMLLHKIISEDVWQTVMITVICAAGGVRLADTYSSAAAARRTVQRTKPASVTEEEYEYEESETPDAGSSMPCGRTAHTAAGIQRAAGKGKERIRTLLTGGTGKAGADADDSGTARPDRRNY
jgi:hypothetical protein